MGCEITETGFVFAGRRVRLIVRRQPRGRGAQLAFDDVDGWRFHAIITNVPKSFMSAVTVELHHRLRGGAPEEAIRQLKGDFGMNHAPVTGFLGNWLWWLAAAGSVTSPPQPSKTTTPTATKRPFSPRRSTRTPPQPRPERLAAKSGSDAPARGQTQASTQRGRRRAYPA